MVLDSVFESLCETRLDVDLDCVEVVNCYSCFSAVETVAVAGCTRVGVNTELDEGFVVLSDVNEVYFLKLRRGC